MSVAIVSGGLDSSTMLMTMVAEGQRPLVLTFDYGQRHDIEIQRAGAIVQYIRKTYDIVLEHEVIVVPTLRGSALTGLSEIPKEDYSVETQKVTVVPNRNMVFLAIGANRAIAAGKQEIWYAAHKNDRAVYPDCTMEFVQALNITLYKGTYGQPQVVAPFINHMKSDIVKIGASINMPFDLTWSCYDPVTYRHTPPKHCGVCGTCRERKLAFKFAGVEDPTIYADE